MSANGTASAHVSFRDDFSRLRPLILEEWPQIDGDALAQTEGDWDLLVALIATETEHSKALVKKQLGEIADVAQTQEPGGSDKDAEQDAEIKRLQRMVDRLTARSHEVSDYVRKQMLEDARGQVAKNPLVALLMAVGLGFVLGFILRGLGRGRGA